MFDKKAVFWNTAIQSVVRVTTLIFTLISIKLLTNYLGTSGVGEYNTITTYVNFFIVIADLGLFSVAVREIAKDPDRERKIISNVFTVRFVSATLACILAVLILFLTPYRTNYDLFYGVIIACGFLFFNLLASIYDIVLQYRLKMQFSALGEFLSKIITIFALYLIIRSHGSFLMVVSTVALSGVLIFFFKWLFARQFIKFGFENDRKMARWIFNLAWPMGIFYIINNLFLKLDTLMLYAIKGAAAVGIYSVAYKVLEVTVFIGSYFSGALKPMLAQNVDGNKEALAKIVEKSLTIMVFVAAPITAVCIAFSKEIILFLSNNDFISGAPALIILAFALPLTYMSVLLSEILIANDERKTLLKIATTVLLFNFIFNLVFIPRFSIIGAALGNVFSQILLAAINFKYAKKIIRFRVNLNQLTQIVCLTALTIFAAFLLKITNLNFILLIVFSLGFYAFFALALKIVNKNSLKELFAR